MLSYCMGHGKSKDLQVLIKQVYIFNAKDHGTSQEIAIRSRTGIEKSEPKNVKSLRIISICLHK